MLSQTLSIYEVLHTIRKRKGGIEPGPSGVMASSSDYYSMPSQDT